MNPIFLEAGLRQKQLTHIHLIDSLVSFLSINSEAVSLINRASSLLIIHRSFP